MPDLLSISSDALCPEQPWLLPLFFALFGACIGSFLNVVIYRLPLGLSVSEPRRSFCPHCKAPIPWYLNIPVLSWLMLRGRSACCGRPITARYCVVELGTALLFAALTWVFSYVALPALVALCAWTALMVACFCIDWEQMVVLPKLTLGAAVCGVAAVALEPALADALIPELSEALWQSALGALGGFALFRLIALLGRLLFGKKGRRFETPQHWMVQQAPDGEDIELSFADGEKRLWSELFMESSNRLHLHEATTEGQESPAELILAPEQLELADGRTLALESVPRLSGSCGGYTLHREAMGSGDAWLALAIGALCGWQGMVFSLVIGSFLGLPAALINRVGFGRPLPFGPPLIAASLLWLFFGQQLIGLYCELSGL